EFLKVVHGKVGGDVPAVDMEKEKRLHDLLLRLIEEDVIRSAHDVSVGGLAITLLECLFGSGLGMDLNLYIEDRLDFFLFSENPSLVVLSVEKEKAERLKDEVEASGLDWMLLGRVREDGLFTLTNNEESIFENSVKEFEEIWQKALENML
ncbi:MAG TPA: phosphoribosylformylglycinamidine synthase II, partial [Aquificaceae bacterium]|nr:phosphoribosylformylglycinamidine synthase II [Aquificaceae bacterium]